jgi:hypothetical protein
MDAFWSQATATIRGDGDKVAQAIKISKTVGLLGPYESKGQLPEFNHCGYEVGIEMVIQSCQPGRYSAEYIQFDTFRKLRSAFPNHCRASAQANHVSLELGDQKGRYQ